MKNTNARELQIIKLEQYINKAMCEMNCERVKEVIVNVDKNTIAQLEPCNDPANEMAAIVYGYITEEDIFIGDNYKFEKVDSGLYLLSVYTIEYKENLESNGDANMNNNIINNNNEVVKGANTMINTTGFNKTMKALNRKEVIEVTKVNFMDRMNRDYGHSIQGDENLGVGQITIASNVFSAISLMSDEKFKPIALRALTEVLGKKAGFNQGFGEYYGLLVEEIVADGVTMDYVTVSKVQEEAIIEEMISCDLNDVKNLRKIFNDINDLFRMYQELTIDAAKKLYVIVATFHNEIMRANSTVALEHNFVNFKDMNEFSIDRASKYVAPKTAELGEMVEFKNKKDEVMKVAFKDTISEVQDIISDQFAELVNGELKDRYATVKLSDEIVSSFGLGTEFGCLAADLYEAVRKVYSKLTAWKTEELQKAKASLDAKKITAFGHSQRIQEVEGVYTEQIEELSNLARFYTQDLDMATAGKLMFMISNIKRVGKEWIVDEDSTNQMFLAVAPELFAAYIVAEHAEMDLCGYKILGDTSSLVEGQVLTFVNGNAQEVENVYVDSLYDGQLTVQLVDDVLCVVKKIEIPRIAATTPKTIALSLMEYSVIDAINFAAKKEISVTGTFETLTTQKVFEKAEKIQVVPFFTYKDAKGKTRHYYDVIVCTIPSLNDPNVKFEIPVCKYACKSALFESKIAGLTVAKVNKYNIDGKTMRLQLEYGNFETVDLNHSKAIDDNTVVADLNNDPFASTVKVSNAPVVQDDPFAAIDNTIATDSTSTEITDNEIFGSNYDFSDEAFADFDEYFEDSYESSVIGESIFA